MVLGVPSESPVECLLAQLNCFAFDFVVRQSLAGTHLSFTLLKQLAVVPRAAYDRPCPWEAKGPRAEINASLAAWLRPRILELTYTNWDLEGFAKDGGYNGPPFRWDAERRFLIRSELDAAFFHLYGIAREDVDYIMDTFPIVRRKDEELYGTYRTRDTILEIYDALADAVRTGQPYQTRLNPPPADPSIAHAPRLTAPPIREEVQVGRIVSFLVLLLRTWRKPAARNVLEAAIVLMLNDTARRQILGCSGTSVRAETQRSAPEFVQGLDGLLQDIQLTGFVEIATIRGRQAIRLGAKAPPTDNAPAADVERLQETLKVLEIVGEDQALVELEGIVHERYTLVP